MTVSVKSLIRLGQAPRGTTGGAANGGALNSIFFYSTADAFATVDTDGYFNSVRAQLAVGDIIIVSAASNKGGLYTVSSVPASGDVAVVASVLS